MLSPFQTKTSGTYSLATTDRYIRGDATAGDVTLNLPAAVGKKDINFFVKKVDTGAHHVIINPPGGHTIDGNASFTISGSSQCVWFISLANGDYESISGSLAGFTVAAIGTVYAHSTTTNWAPTGSLAPRSPTESLTFTLPNDGDVIIEVCGAFDNGISNFVSAALGIRIAGVDHNLAPWTVNNGGGGDYNGTVPLTGFAKVGLSAGTYTMELLASTSGSTLLAGATIKVTFAGAGDSGQVVTVQKNGSTVSTWPTVDFEEGANVTLTITDDSGSSRTKVIIAAAGGTGSDMLGKDFFTDRSLLPVTKIKEELFVFPTTDFANLNSYTVANNRSRRKITPAGSSAPMNFGWDIGSTKSTVLFIMGMVRARKDGIGIFISDTLPSTSELPNKSYLVEWEPATGIQLFKRTGGAYTSLGSDTTVSLADAITNPSSGLALYYDDGTDTLIVFIKIGPEEWWPIFDIIDTALTTFRYCGVRVQGTSSADIMYVGCPMACYTN